MRAISICILGAAVLGCGAPADAGAPGSGGPATAGPATASPGPATASPGPAPATPGPATAGPATASPGPADPAGAAGKRDCSKPAMRKVRAEADKAATAKDYVRAIGLLEPFLHDCHDAKGLTDRAWLASDLAVSYDRNGQYVECQRILAPLSHPSSGLAESGSDKLVKAIEHNLDHCSKALDAKYAAIKPGGCTLTIDKAIATAAAPPAVVPKGATAACVALVRGKRPPKAAGDDPDSQDVVCPVVALIWKGAKPALERQELTASGTGALGEDSVCCNLSSIAAGTLDGKTLVRVRGQGRDCNGGTADSAADTFYDWTGASLRSALDASVGFH